MKRHLATIVLCAAMLFPAHTFAQEVFTGDPVDTAGTGMPYPIMPGVALLLPGDNEKFGDGDDVINTGIVGDVDLVVRSGVITSSAIPAPALTGGGPAIVTVVAGGGSSGRGVEADFTVMVSDGTGSPAYGNVVSNADMDARPVTVYAFADLDGDGIVGRTNADTGGAADNEFEKQEATALSGRQMGMFLDGVFQDSLGLEIAAPASIGGLRTTLVAGAWTGTDSTSLYTDGPLILTRWPFFPPLDPKDLLGGGDAPDPLPDQPNELEWSIEKNWLPEPANGTYGTPFALPVDGSEPTTDQVRVDSGAALSARVFAQPVVSSYLARSSARLRVAPPVGGSGRVLVMPISRAVLAADGPATQLTVRVLPVDLFANVADPASAMSVTLTLTGPASIASPDTNGDLKSETISLTDAGGVDVVLDDTAAGTATLLLSVDASPVQSLGITIAAAADSDGDGVPDDGNTSSVVGDKPCDGDTASCDDNCPRVINPSQVDSDQDGLGDCCDGSCEFDPLGDACGECELPIDPPPPTLGGLDSGSISLRSGDATKADRLKLKIDFTLDSSAALNLDAETFALALTQAGSAGYSATLVSLFTDLNKTAPYFRYRDRNSIVDGVKKAQVKCRTNLTCRMQLQAHGIALADLATGDADLTLALGDDLYSGTVSCTSLSNGRVRCGLVP